MRISGPQWLGPLILLGAVAGCTASVDADPRGAGDPAIPSYQPPEDAPPFCSTLADSVHVDGMPVALGTLTADPEDRVAVAQLEDARAELEDVLAAVPDEERYAELTAGLEYLLAAVHSATVNPVEDDLRTRISTRLDAFGSLVQPVCVFPA